MQNTNLAPRHRPLAQRELEVPVVSYAAPASLKHAQITSIYQRAGKGGKLYVGVTFNDNKADSLQDRLKNKHGISVGNNVKASGQYDTKNPQRQRELVKIARHDGVITEEQANEILTNIAVMVVVRENRKKK